MEEFNAKPIEVSNNDQPQITPQSLKYLLTAAKWGKFLSILGFISIGFLVIAGLLMSLVFSIMGSEMQEMPGLFSKVSPTVLSIFYIVLGVVFLLPVYYMNSFSNNVSKAARNNDTMALTMALRRLKNLFAFAGIYTIAILALYVIIVIAVATSAILTM